MKGKLISHYRIIDELGAGGMGVVYRAEDTKLGRAVALKFILPQSLQEAEEKKRFLHEAQAAASLSHPNICVVHEIDEADGALFMAMELVEGESLKSKIGRGPLPVEEAVDIALQTAHGLEAAHRKGIVHRDIKPANIMVEPDGLVKIMDFGLAKLTGRSVLTKEGTTLGTVAYMSPEQARGREADGRSDLWSLGVILYEMVTGRPPFRADYEQAVLYAIMNEAPEPITAVRSGVPMDLERIVAKALAKDPAERYQHADELAADLKSLQRGLADVGTSRPAAAPAKPPRARLARVLIPLCAAAAAVTVFILLRPVIFGGAVATERHPVAVIIFENQTGDPQYDNLRKVIPNLLITSLEQSKYLQVVTWERLQDLGRQAGRENVEDIDADLGFELCRREKIDAIVIGSFTKLGDRFVTDIKVLDVGTKGNLAVATADGRGLESIPEQVDRLSRQISRGVGLSERKIEETQRPVIDVTTSSIEAYTYYLKGVDAYERLYYVDAVRNFRKAIDIDSTFAVAHLFIGKCYSNTYDRPRMVHAYAKAMEKAGKATERERLYIEAQHAVSARDNDVEAIRMYRELIEKYPNEKQAWGFLGRLYRVERRYREAIQSQEHALELDPTYGPALNELAYIYMAMADYEKALEHLRRYSALYPGDANPYDSMGEAYFRMGKLEEAARMYERAFEMKPMMASRVMRSYLFGMRGNYHEAIEWIDRQIQSETLSGQLAVEHCWRAFYHACLGEFGNAARDARRVFAIADSTGDTDWMQIGRQMEGFVLYERGRLEDAREFFRTRYAVPGVNTASRPFLFAFAECYAGIIEAAAGDARAGREAAKRLETLLPAVRSDSERNFEIARNWLVMLEAELLLAEGRPNEAIGRIAEDFKPLMPTSGPQLFYVNAPFNQDVVARAYAAKGDLDRAITEYKRLLTFDPAAKDRRQKNPRYEYRLAKLLEGAGRRSEALEHYEAFLEYWKNADRDLPELIDAKARAAALRPSASHVGSGRGAALD